MDYSLIAKGFGFGIMVSAPLGPLGILCIQRTLTRGFRSGFISGLGAAIADLYYASIAGFGISVIANFLSNQQVAIRLFGGFILFVLGVGIIRNRSFQGSQNRKNNHSSYLRDFISSFFITITNPLTIVVFGIAFTSVGLNASTSYTCIITTLLGVFMGALIWWLCLSFFIKSFRNRIGQKKLDCINKWTGTLVATSGLVVFLIQLFSILNS